MADPVTVLETPEALAERVAADFVTLVTQTLAGQERFSVALAGGQTPKQFYERLAKEPYKSSIPWSKIWFFWGDERCVPPDHPDSNYRMTNETLLSRVPVPRENVFRIPAELPDPERAAQEYAATLTRFFFGGSSANQTGTAPLSNVPRFHLVFLGLGPDGHTASLFPHTTALQAGDQIAVANYVEKIKAHRITLTAATINNARNVTFLAAGEDKAETLKNVLERSYQPDLYPSQLIRPRNGTLLWMVDEAAARLLADQHLAE